MGYSGAGGGGGAQRRETETETERESCKMNARVGNCEPRTSRDHLSQGCDLPTPTRYFR